MAADRDYEFDTILCDNLFSPSNNLVVDRALGPTGRCLAFADTTVLAYYGDRIRGYFDGHGVQAKIIPVDLGEEDKTTDTLLYLLRRIEDFGPLRRSEPILAIGGGVLLDAVGLAAGLYRRGVPYVRIPTTLVGLVDVSVASKTAVNFAGRRNRVGMYHPPLVSLLDRSFLATLKPEHISDGLGEIVKLAVVTDLELLRLVEDSGGVDVDFLLGPKGRELIERSVVGMIEQLRVNLWERELCRAVDFGHSFSPLIEMGAEPPLTHGQAVGLDVLLSSAIAEARGLVESGTPERVAELLRRCRLPTAHPDFAAPELLWRALEDTVRHRNGHQHLPLPAPLGGCTFIEDLRPDEVTAAAQRIARRG